MLNCERKRERLSPLERKRDFMQGFDKEIREGNPIKRFHKKIH
jgi:hypothetical protein